MQKFIKRILVFSLPFIVWLVVVVLIDPFNYFKYSLNVIDNNLKKESAFKLNRPLFQLLAYENHPTSSILLGDSRANSLKCEILKKYSRQDFANLAYGGGSLQEVINTFWLISKKNILKDVYIGINFTNYNKYSNRDRVTEVKAIMKNFFSYAFSPYTFNSIYTILKSVITGNEIKIGVPELSKEKFWLYQLNVSAKQHYNIYEYPSNYFHDLQEISKNCNNRGIHLVLFIPPTHTDLQNKVKEYNLQNNETKFKDDLKKIGDVYDFDYPSDITGNKNNFRDPYHCTDSIGEIVVKELFSNKPSKNARFTKCTTYSNFKPKITSKIIITTSKGK
jgi:hypothetical protein